MKSQGWSDEIDEWRNILQFDTAEISVALKIPLLEVAPVAQPMGDVLAHQGLQPSFGFE
jgi:hypothetical protein